MTGLFVFTLESCTLAQEFEEVGKMELIIQGWMRCLLKGAFEVLDGEAVVVLGVVIGGEGVGAAAREFGIVGDLLGRCTTINEMVGDGGCAFFFPTSVFLAQDFGSTSMEADTPGCRDALIEVGD